jgi:hypothetical protein
MLAKKMDKALTEVRLAKRILRARGASDSTRVVRGDDLPLQSWNYHLRLE